MTLLYFACFRGGQQSLMKVVITLKYVLFMWGIGLLEGIHVDPKTQMRSLCFQWCFIGGRGQWYMIMHTNRLLLKVSPDNIYLFVPWGLQHSLIGGFLSCFAEICVHSNYFGIVSLFFLYTENHVSIITGLGLIPVSLSFASTRKADKQWRPGLLLKSCHSEFHGISGPINRQLLSDLWKPLQPVLSAFLRPERLKLNCHFVFLCCQVFGSLDFSRRDLMAINIQRGRDHGVPDYNTVREAYGLPRIRRFYDINPSQYNASEDIRNVRWSKLVLSVF